MRLDQSSLLIRCIDGLFNAVNAPQRNILGPALGSPFTTYTGRSQDWPHEHPELSTTERRTLTVAAAAIAAGRPERAVEVLEAHIDGYNARAHPRIFERLADAYLALGRAEPAEDVLLRGLESYPDDPGLRLALATALASGSKWDAALSQWRQVPDAMQDAAGAWTRVGIARAYRETGDPVEAANVANSVGESAEQIEALRNEIRLCRPFLTDWPRSWVGLPGRDDENGAGTIDSMGFLHGGSQPLRGRIESNRNNESKVWLVVNDREVSSTIATEDLHVSPGKAFAINCADLLQYIGDGDIVKVVCGREPVPLPTLGHSAKLACEHESQIEALFAMLDDGFVFTKDGRLRPGHNATSKRTLLEFFARVSDLITAGTGQPVYPFYGNLLGAIRENEFIEHDVGGFDILYLCKHEGPDDVRAEIANVCGLLLKRGFHLKIKPHSITVRDTDGDTAFLDLSYGWFNSSDEFNVSFGWRFEPARGRERFVHGRNCRLMDREIAVPGNSEEVLEQLYGPQWRVTDQGFSTYSGLRRDDAYLLSEADILSLESNT